MNHLRALHAVDHVLLHALLTALVAPNTHLIVRTPQHDISLVARLLVWTLSSVFDYPTHRVKLHPSPPPSTKHFLKSLFFTNPSASSASTHTSQDESPDPTKSRRSKSRHSRTIHHHRQPDTVTTPPSSPHLHVDPLGLLNISNKSTTGRFPPDSLGVHYQPRNNLPKENSSPPQLPRALVISGIEDATLECQRALARVMTDTRITFDPTANSKAEESWDLPDGFIVIYICPIDPRERPNIHHSLLDKFAMSCNVLIKPNLRQAIQSSIPPSNPKRPISVAGSGGGGHHSNTSSPLINPHIPLPPSSRLSLHRNSYHSASASASSFHRDQPSLTLTVPTLPNNFISNLRKAYHETYVSPTLVTYLNDLFSATRHRAELDGTFLTARCVSDAERLARAHRVVGSDLNGMELLREGEDQDWLRDERSDDDDQEEDDDDDEEEDDENSDEQWQTVEADELSAFGISFNPKKTSTISKNKKQQQINIPKLEVTEINIARMFPRCVSHRLRVRDGPREEVFASMVFGATFDFDFDGGGDERFGEVYLGKYEERPTVKDVLVSILSEV